MSTLSALKCLKSLFVVCCPSLSPFLLQWFLFRVWLSFISIMGLQQSPFFSWVYFTTFLPMSFLSHHMHWSSLRWRIVFPMICAVDLFFFFFFSYNAVLSAALRGEHRDGYSTLISPKHVFHLYSKKKKKKKRQKPARDFELGLPSKKSKWPLDFHCI